MDSQEKNGVLSKDTSAAAMHLGDECHHDASMRMDEENIDVNCTNGSQDSYAVIEPTLPITRASSCKSCNSLSSSVSSGKLTTTTSTVSVCEMCDDFTDDDRGEKKKEDTDDFFIFWC